MSSLPSAWLRRTAPANTLCRPLALTRSGRRLRRRLRAVAARHPRLPAPRRCHGERTGVAHVGRGGLDPAVGTLDVRDPELVDVAVEGIGDAARKPSDPKRVRIEIQGLRVAHLRDTGAIEIETLVVGAGVLVIGPDNIAPTPIAEGACDVVLQPVVGAEEVPGEPAAIVVEDVAAFLAADDGPTRPAELTSSRFSLVVSSPAVTTMSAPSDRAWVNRLGSTIALVISTGKSVRSSATRVWSIVIFWRYSQLGSYQANAQLPRVPAKVSETPARGGIGRILVDGAEAVTGREAGRGGQSKDRRGARRRVLVNRSRSLLRSNRRWLETRAGSPAAGSLAPRTRRAPEGRPARQSVPPR